VLYFTHETAKQDSVASVIKKLKGGSSHVLRSEFPDLAEFLWGNSFWAVGYFAATVGVVEGSVVSEYIRAQQIS
jgi:putative transposase